MKQEMDKFLSLPFADSSDEKMPTVSCRLPVRDGTRWTQKRVTLTWSQANQLAALCATLDEWRRLTDPTVSTKEKRAIIEAPRKLH